MKKVISLALFGTGDSYSQYVRAFIRAHLNLFPIDQGWFLRVHYDDVMLATSTGNLLRHYAWDSLIELRHMGESKGKCHSMVWRLNPVFDEDVSHVFSRDLDAIPMPRDRAVCEQFIASGADMGTAHDNIHHVGVMGGLCHFNAAKFKTATAFKSLDDIYNLVRGIDWDRHGADQDVLNRIISVWTNITLLEHRYSGWSKGSSSNNGKRPAGQYHCDAYSKPLPDTGIAPKLSLENLTAADALGNHLGCAGYDHEHAQQWWDENGDQELRRRIEAAECAAEEP